MSRVILHIGTHKTATTTIQDMFAHNAPLLAQHGLIYPRLGRMTGHHGLVTDWVQSLPRVYAYPSGSVAMLRHIAARHADTDETVFLSSEEFSRGDPTAQPDFAAIREALGGFARIEVLCVLREQWQFIQSVYLEVSKICQPRRPPEFLDSVLAHDMVEGLWTDYNRLLDHVSQNFAPEEITLLDFDQCRKAPGGVIGAVLGHAGVALSPDALEAVNDGRSNPSPQAVPSWAANLVAAPHAAPPWLITATTGAFETQFGKGTRNCLWTREEFQRLSAYADDRNRRLSERRKPYQPDFAITRTDLSDGQTIFRDSLQTDYWVRASRWIYEASRRSMAG